jgi:hypothetical protein
MSYSSYAGILVATQSDYLAASATSFSQLTDHNRDALSLSYEVIEKASRMADGTLRKYVVAKKRKVSTSWKELPSGTLGPYNSSSAGNGGLTMTVDGNRGGAWMKTFYEANLFKPVRVRIMHSKDIGPGLSASAYAASSFFPSPYITASGALTKVGGYEEFWAFIDNFSYDVVKRYALTDIVNISMSFTEI